MKLLVISRAVPPFSAPETAQTLFLCERLAQRGLTIDLLTTRGSALPKSLPSSVKLCPFISDWGWRGLPQFAAALRESQADAILLIYIDWIYDCHPMITFAPILARRFNKRVRFFTLLENENGLSHIEPRPSWCSSVARRLASRVAGSRGLHRSYGALLRDSDGILALSEEHLRAFELAEPSVRAKAEVLPASMMVQVLPEGTGGSNRRRGRQTLGIAEQPFVITFFGYVYPLKDLETLITAFAKLVGNVHLIIIGGFDEGPYIEGLRQLCRDLGVADKVRWLGYREDAEASLYLQTADLAVLPFTAGVRLNNSSFAAVAAHGLPIITTRGNSLDSVFVDGENVRLCPPRDPGALLQALNGLIAQPEIRKRLGAGARHLAENYFSPDRLIDLLMRRLSLDSAALPN